VVLKATAPGVPDVYQGCETWSRSLVDPDNRRPVAFGALDDRLGELAGVATATELLRPWRDGGVKLDVTRRLLHLRREEPALFDGSAYLPLEVRGARADHLVAFARHHGDRRSGTGVPRLVLTAAGPGRMPTGADL
jgi:(1->4)-alpha-D-glucan 1-alpha-D-glucosylmutase